jgi:ABC-type antimicrobial peptide transport system permease subunit
MWGGMGLTGIGLGFSMTGAVALAKWLSSLLFRVPAYDPVTLALVALVLLTALAAGLIPARRAARVNPINGLRAD